jgi:hypothetical protein
VALTSSLLLVGGLVACDQDDGARATSATGGSMMQRQSSDRDGPGFPEGPLRDRLGAWCQDLLQDRSWSRLDGHDRAEVMRTMRRGMLDLWDDSAVPMMSLKQMPGRAMMYRACRPVG